MRCVLVVLGANLWLVLSGAASCAQSFTGQHPLTQTQQSAWQAIGQITYGDAVNGSICTGTLVAADLVLTAGHCVSRDGVPMQAADIEFAAGRHSGKSSATRRAAEIILAQPTIGQSRAMPQDVALIVLDMPIDAATVRPLPLSRQDLFSERYSFAGYQRQKPDILQQDENCDLAGVRPGVLLLGCPVVSGNSGGPVLMLRHGQWQVSAVMVAQANGGSEVQSYAVIPGDDLRARIAGP